LGWDNVQVICADACSNPNFMKENEKAALVTFSYSLSMIPNFFAAVDFAKSILHENGLIGVVDFGVSDKTDPVDRHFGWFMRWFWQIWFEFDHISLHSSRRKYVEHSFSRLKDYTGRNYQMLGVPMPYYMYLGCRNNFLASSFLNEWRLGFKDSEKSIWDTYMYAFAWEDPEEDFKVMDLKKDDRVLAITSGGCNILDFLVNEVEHVWSVDMNPAQNNLLELKVAAIKSEIPYEDFWKLFGTGKYENFNEFLDMKLSANLSAPAYRFWKRNASTFENKGLYNTGHSGSAIKFARFVFKLFGVSENVKAFCNAKTSVESWKLWSESLKPALFNRFIVNVIFNTRHFMWKALGVPEKQMEMLLNEFDGDLYKCVSDTLDPIGKNGIIPRNNYFYYCCLMSEYSQNCCPEYLKRSNYESLQKALNVKNLRIHTSKIIDVLKSGGPSGKKFSKVVIMDHMDWFNKELAQEEIDALWDAVEDSGKIFWRSAESLPWYNALFKKRGFQVNQLAIRKSGDMIDRVNMYLSFNVATKPSKSKSTETSAEA
jgi:betaine lipid synthase